MLATPSGVTMGESSVSVVPLVVDVGAKLFYIRAGEVRDFLNPRKDADSQFTITDI